MRKVSLLYDTGILFYADIVVNNILYILCIDL